MKDISRVRLAVLVCDGVSALPFETLVREIVAGGADLVQLREKSLADGVLLERAKLCRDICRDCIFIVNDRADIAVLSKADGVHVGPEDLPVAAARQILGRGLIGASAYGIKEIIAAEKAGADYLGVGAVFPTGTKDVAGLVAGLPLVSEASRIATRPWFAIGGITLENVSSVVAAGARAVAVSSAILRSSDPRGATDSVKSAISRALQQTAP